MDLLLWRHAHALDALPGQPDRDRELSRKGEKQAAAMATWLNARLPDNARILCSPSKRTLQTVSFLKRSYEICEDVAPEANASALLTAANWPNAQTAVLVVAHQPFLGETVEHLLNLNPAKPLSFRKGGLWWLKLRNKDDVAEVELVCVENPKIII